MIQKVDPAAYRTINQQKESSYDLYLLFRLSVSFRNIRSLKEYSLPIYFRQVFPDLRHREGNALHLEQRPQDPRQPQVLQLLSRQQVHMSLRMLQNLMSNCD